MRGLWVHAIHLVMQQVQQVQRQQVRVLVLP